MNENTLGKRMRFMLIVVGVQACIAITIGAIIFLTPDLREMLITSFSE